MKSTRHFSLEIGADGHDDVENVPHIHVLLLMAIATCKAGVVLHVLVHFADGHDDVGGVPHVHVCGPDGHDDANSYCSQF